MLGASATGSKNHGFVRALGRLLGLGLGRDLLLDLDQFAALALGLFVGLLSLFALSLFARRLGLDDKLDNMNIIRTSIGLSNVYKG